MHAKPWIRPSAWRGPPRAYNAGPCLHVSHSQLAPRAARLLIVLGLTLASGPALPAAPEEASVEPLPNIMLILSDDQHWRDYSYTGENSFVRTPNIDALAKDGVLFQRAYVPTSICRPSLLNIFTGLPSVTTGVTGNAPTPSGDRKRDRRANRMLRRAVSFHPTLPRLLAERGYRSLQTGKWWEGDATRAGFDQGMTRERSRMLGPPVARSIGRAGLDRIETFVAEANADGVPFFVSYAPLLPHHPHLPAGSLDQRYAALVAQGDLTPSQAAYYATVEWFDETVGSLRQFLRQLKRPDGSSVEDHTLYVYAADNGWTQPPTGPPSALGAPNGKITPREGGVRTPLIFYWKGHVFDSRLIEAKRDDPRLGSTLDILPTLLAVIGAAELQPAEAPGINLLDASRGAVFGDTYEHDIPVTTGGPIRFLPPATARTSRWMIEGRWKLILDDTPPNGPTAQLFDLTNDPDETRDRAASDPERTRDLMTKIEQWWARSLPTTEYAHQFSGSAAPLNGTAPDRTGSRASARWIAERAGRDGRLAVGCAMTLPWEPRSDQRYELRVVGTDILFGFLSAFPGSTFSSTGIGWAQVTDNQAALLARDAQGREPSRVTAPRGGGRQSAASLVLDTRDHDDAQPGEQWALSLRLEGIERARHLYETAPPAIHAVGVRCAGDTGGEIEMLELRSTPASG